MDTGGRLSRSELKVFRTLKEAIRDLEHRTVTTHVNLRSAVGARYQFRPVDLSREAEDYSFKAEADFAIVDDSEGATASSLRSMGRTIEIPGDARRIA
jgi:hypothetical protein